MIRARALAVACTVALVSSSLGTRAHAQDAADTQSPSTELVVLTGIGSGINAGLATYVWTMPWRGFWNNSAELDSPFALVLAAVGSIGLGIAASLLAEGSDDRMAILAISAAAGLAFESAVLLYGGLYHWLAPPGACEEGCTKLLFGSVPLVATLVGFTGALIHLATE